MLERLIIRHCAPTLAGLKTGSVINCPYKDREEILYAVQNLNQRLSFYGLFVIPLRILENKILVYLYRPDKLTEDLASEDAADILKNYGYPVGDFRKCIARLCRRLEESEEFPHEIGLFLGYPSEDVLGFITKHAYDYKCAGYWKVYGDAKKAERIFEQYRKCTELYCLQWEKGKSIEQLAAQGFPFW